MTYRFMQFPDPDDNDKWKIYGNFPSQIIQEEHTEKDKDVFIISEFNKAGHRRETDELAIMATMHEADLRRQKRKLSNAASEASAKFKTLKGPAKFYQFAAQKI